MGFPSNDGVLAVWYPRSPGEIVDCKKSGFFFATLEDDAGVLEEKLKTIHYELTSDKYKTMLQEMRSDANKEPLFLQSTISPGDLGYHTARTPSLDGKPGQRRPL